MLERRRRVAVGWELGFGLGFVRLGSGLAVVGLVLRVRAFYPLQYPHCQVLRCRDYATVSVGCDDRSGISVRDVYKKPKHISRAFEFSDKAYFCTSCRWF